MYAIKGFFMTLFLDIAYFISEDFYFEVMETTKAKMPNHLSNEMKDNILMASFGKRYLKRKMKKGKYNG